MVAPCGQVDIGKLLRCTVIQQAEMLTMTQLYTDLAVVEGHLDIATLIQVATVVEPSIRSMTMQVPPQQTTPLLLTIVLLFLPLLKPFAGLWLVQACYHHCYLNNHSHYMTSVLTMIIKI